MGSKTERTKKTTPDIWKKFYKLNSYYHKDLQKLAKHLIPKNASVIEFGCKGGELLSCLPNKVKYAVILNQELLGLAGRKLASSRIMRISSFTKTLGGKTFDYIHLSHTLSEIENIQGFLRNIRRLCHKDTRIIVVYFNFLWKPFLDIAEKLGLRLPAAKEPNWLTEVDVDNFFHLENFDKVKSGKRFIIPYSLPLYSDGASGFSSIFTTPASEVTHFEINGYSNAWIIDKTGSYSLSILYWPQVIFRLGLIASAVSFATFLLVFAMLRRGKVNG